MSEVCTRCGGASHVAHGRRECVASWEGEESTTPWTVGVCQPCGLTDLAEDRRKTTRVAPVKGLVLTILGLGTGMAAFISLQDPGWEKLWAVLFLLLAVPATIRGATLLLTIPAVLRRLKATAGRLEEGALEGDDEDLLVHLEAHRILEVLQSGSGWVYGDLRLPETPDADLNKIKYELRHPEHGSAPD